MPRGAAFKGTAKYPKDMKISPPFIEKFVSLITVDVVGGSTTTEDLYEEYKAFVRKRTDDQELNDLAGKFRRFSTYMRRRASQENWEFITYPRRGYKIKVERDRRATCTTNSDALRRAAKEFLQLSEEAKRDKAKHNMRRVLLGQVDGQDNHGAFANRTIDAGSVVCEYIGQEISRKEGEKRDKDYAHAHGRNVTMFFINENVCFDGYCKPNGQPIKIEDNPGTWLNHKRLQPNCKPFHLKEGEEDGKMVIRTLRDVTAGEELTWDYGDRRKNLEAWMYE